MEPAGVVAIIMLLGASVSDLRTRRVPNSYWLPFLVAAGFLGVTAGASLAAWLWALGACAFLYGMWWLGLFGGADAKGLMVVSLLLPTAPDLLGDRVTSALDVLINGTMLVVVLPVLFIAWNVARGDVRLPAMLLGFRSAGRRNVWPMQRIENGALRWRYLHRPGGDADMAFTQLEAAGVVRPWVTPKVPFMLPLTGGLILLFTHGNLVFVALRWMMGV